MRVHPILTFTERDVWDFILKNKIPIHPLYYEGYRPIDDKYETKKFSDKPAWEQDLEGTEEIFGRAQDKENMMGILSKVWLYVDGQLGSDCFGHFEKGCVLRVCGAEA